MNKDELKKLIAECVAEVIQEQGVEEGWGKDFVRGVKRMAAPSWDQLGRDSSERKRKFDAANPAQKEELRAKARKQIMNAVSEMEKDLQDYLGEISSAIEAGGIDRTKVGPYISKKLQKVINDYYS
jgi:hypothetical protein